MAVRDFDWLGKTTDKLRKNLRAKAGTIVEQTIADWIEEKIEFAQNILEQKNRVGSGALSTSIRPKDLVTNDEKVLVEIIAEDYWDFINQGVNGTKTVFSDTPYSFRTSGVGEKMKQSFVKFIQVNGITPREPEMDYDQLAYILARSVKRKGIRKTPFMDEAFSPEAIKDLADRLGKTVKRIFE
jgi:hypothetical protein|tara:strand:- start:84 stop:635 length:552 start_codon:yes stop_codon:yes gene_type:complete